VAAEKPKKASDSNALSNGTFTVQSFKDGKLIIKLEKESYLTSVEISSGKKKIKAESFSNLDANMRMEADGYLFEVGRISCTFKLPNGYKPEKVYITSKKGDKPIEFDISGL
jgi:hypothetical protein